MNVTEFMSLSECFRAFLLDKCMPVPVMILLGKIVFNRNHMTNMFDPSFYFLAPIIALSKNHIYLSDTVTGEDLKWHSRNCWASATPLWGFIFLPA